MSKPSAILVLLILSCAGGAAQTRAPVAPAPSEASVERGTLAEIRNRRSVMVLVGKSLSVDARVPAGVSDEDVRGALSDRRARTHMGAYRVIASRLNKYVRKYRSLTAVETRADADIYVVFRVAREVPSFVEGHPFSYGKMFVVTSDEGRPPRLLWESSGTMKLAEDATGELIRALKEARGER